ncbi:MAG: hypothetical protein ABIT37_08280 [Luteolibacter sp.]
MPEIASPSYVLPLTVLLVCCLVMLVFLLFMSFRILSRLGWIERRLEQQKADVQVAETGPTVAESSPGGAFEAFLDEDPARRELTKSEQFTAFRQWRHAKGMNWSNS